jgi:hypothetical protein
MEYGYKFDYTPSNWNLSHGNVTFAATPWNGSGSWKDDDAVSQAQVMLPDGTWRSFCNWGIFKTFVTENSCGSCQITKIVTPEPTQPAGIQNYIRPTFTNVSETFNIYFDDDASNNEYQLEPIEFVQGKPSNVVSTVNMLGSLWRMYWVSRRVAKHGKQNINGKLHLVVPSGWSTRKFHIPHGFTRIIDNDQLLAEQTRIENLSETMNCVIRLED